MIFNNVRLTVNNNKYKCQNFAVTYSNSQKNLNFGLIVNYYKLNDVFAIAQKLRKSKCFTSNDSIEDRLNDYFLICELIEEYEIIFFNAIHKKCVIISKDNEYFISVCNDINEHD